MQQLGNSAQATTLLYLPTPPLVNTNNPLDYGALCELNGNHWRKILIILAKLQCPDTDWRNYRDQLLLKQHEAIIFSDQLLPGKQLQIVAGKASWGRLGLNPEQFSPLEESNRLLRQGNIILTPYPDYRQFPNHLIDQLRPIIHASNKD
ncbi:DUF6942 family protein [Amphritea japonica]|uniref:Uncharacterized protein n=1 Tax=Amphritea japonica ATCC BAA-1530 TaxID=1278309 RepID=A0A7R6PD47_9GAMM|nr:hypothetical protein [Amphritea japonica]BBB27218.1 conserved hypothetical protein [Amphritea japonica ATCC BAA-1530]